MYHYDKNNISQSIIWYPDFTITYNMITQPKPCFFKANYVYSDDLSIFISEKENILYVTFRFEKYVVSFFFT